MATDDQTVVCEVTGFSFQKQAGPKTCVVSVGRLRKLFRVPYNGRDSTQLPFDQARSYAQNYNNIYLLQLGCHPVAVVILHVNKT